MSHANARAATAFLVALYGVAVPLILIWPPVNSTYRGWAGWLSRRIWPQTLAYVVAILASVAILRLPVDAWQYYDVAFVSGLPSAPDRHLWTMFAGFWAVVFVIELCVGTLLVCVLYWVIRVERRFWWLYAAAIVVLSILIPRYLPGLLRRHALSRSSMAQQALEQHDPTLMAQVERVIQHSHAAITPERILYSSVGLPGPETSLNGGVIGFGASKQIEIGPGSDAPQDETLFVIGHEMSHYVLHHSELEAAASVAIGLILAYLASQVATRTLARWGEAWRIGGLQDVGSLPLLLYLFAAADFLSSPAFNMVSRHYEHEADRYALEAIHGIVPNPGRAAAEHFALHEATCKICVTGPLATVWFNDHPSDSERIEFARTYDPWSAGRRPRYVP